MLPHAGEGSSGGAYQNTITEAVPGFIGGLGIGDGPGRNDSERRKDYPRRNHNERQNDRDSSRDHLRNIALTTLQTLDHGEYFPPGQDGSYDLRAKYLWTDENTSYYGPDAGEDGEILESEFIKIIKKGGHEGKEEKEERNKDGITGAGEEANDLNEKQGESESEKAIAGAATKPHDDDKANPKDQTRVQATASQILDNTQTTIYVREYSTLVGARKVHLTLARTDPSTNKKIGVLNFASAKKPGGGFLDGSQAQEESLARSSTLYPSLATDAASQFYAHYLEDPGNAYYTHAMVYSPGIVLIRDDNGEWLSPVEVDVLTSAAVNAGEIRRELEREERSRNEREVMEYWKKKGKAFAEVKSEDKKGEEVEAEENQENIIDSPDNGLGCGSDSQLKGTEEEDDQPQPETPPEINQEPNSSTIVHPLPLPTQLSQAPDPDPNSTYAAALENAEIKIEKTMYARISRILHLFQLHQTPHLILGSFGTGVFKNHIELVATIFADLLIKPGGKFKDVFQTVVFAILGKETVRVFSEVFSNVNKQAQREGTGKTSVIVDSFGNGNGDVKEGDEGKTDAAFHPLSFDGAHANTSSYPTSSAPDAASYAPSFDAAQADAAADAASFIATQASEAANAASSIAVEAGAAASAAASASPFEAAEADAAASAAYSNAAQACAAAYAAYSNAARAYAAAGQADEAALFRGSATAYAASSDAWRYSFMCAAADAASFRQSEATFHPFSFDAAEASGVSSSSDAAAYASSFDNAQPSAAASAFSHADAAAYFTASYNAAQASVAYPPSFDTTKANVVPYPTSLSASHSQADVGVQANPTAVDYHGIPEDAKLISTKDDEQVDFVAEATANAPITPKAIVVDDGKDIEMIETKSLPTRSSEAQSSNLNKKEDGDDESAPC